MARKYLSVSISVLPEDKEKLDVQAKRHGVPVSLLIRRALATYLKKLEKSKALC